MYEKDAFAIRSDILARVPPSFDTRESTLIYIAAAAAAEEMADMVQGVNEAYKNAFFFSAEGAALDEHARFWGVERRDATYSRLRAAMDVAPAVGTRFIGGDYTFVVTELDESGVIIECEDSGSESGAYRGILIPIDTVANLTSASVSATIEYGSDSESDGTLRERVKNAILAAPWNGNSEDWRALAMAAEGIMDARCRYEDGVILTVCASGYRVPSLRNIADCATYVEEHAPLGAQYSIESATLTPLTFDAQVTFSENRELEAHSAAVAALKKYMSVRNSYWGIRGVSISPQSAALILEGIDGIESVESVSVNSQTASFNLDYGALASWGGLICS